jgi:uncharacterized iron-regulated protein
MRTWHGVGWVWLSLSCGGAASGEVDDLVDLPVPPIVAPGGISDGSISDGASSVPSPAPSGDGTERDDATENEGAGNAPDTTARAAEPMYGLTASGELGEAALWDVLAAPSAVCFGETHDNAAHHFAQERATRELALRARARGAILGVGFEMFQTPFQAVVTEFATGSIDERELLDGSEYFARWGYDFAYYRPLLELVREFGLPALALNAPVELTSKIGSVGLDGLTPEERAGLPELDLDDPVYRAYTDGLLGAAHAGGGASENPFTVQVVWDETMAQTASDWLSITGEQARLMIIAGSGHCHRRAIPARVTRRTGLSVLSVSAILASQVGVAGAPTLDLYDVLVVLDDAP